MVLLTTSTTATPDNAGRPHFLIETPDVSSGVGWTELKPDEAFQLAMAILARMDPEKLPRLVGEVQVDIATACRAAHEREKRLENVAVGKSDETESGAPDGLHRLKVLAGEMVEESWQAKQLFNLHTFGTREDGLTELVMSIVHPDYAKRAKLLLAPLAADYASKHLQGGTHAETAQETQAAEGADAGPEDPGSDSEEETNDGSDR